MAHCVSLLAFFCVLSATCPQVQSDGLRQYEVSFTSETSGVSGQLCTRRGRKCVTDAVCTGNETSDCMCEGIGNGLLGCVKDISCIMTPPEWSTSGHHATSQGSITAESIQHCQQHCLNDDRCTAVDFKGTTCTYHHGPVTTTSKWAYKFSRKDCSAGIRCWMMQSVPHRSGDRSGAAGTVSVDTMLECQQYCVSDLHCHAVDFEDQTCTYYHSPTEPEYNFRSYFSRKNCTWCNVTYCQVHGDPHLTTFGGGSHKVRIQFPCLYRLARFVADNGKTGRRGHVTCDVDVRAWNVVVESGRYFVAGLDVRLVLTKTANGRFQTVEVVMTGTGGLDSNGSAVYTLHCEANNMDISPSGHTLLKKWGGVSVWCHVDRDDNLLVLYIPACCTRITYRPHNADQILAPQTQIPGVVITAPVAAVWDTASVPLSMCGTPDDREDLEQTYILHAALTQGILPQDLNSNGYSSSCQQGIEDYTNCPDHLRDSALSLCGDILSRRRLLHCQLQQDPALDIMDNFAKCLRFLCGPGDADSTCQELVVSLAPCLGDLTRRLRGAIPCLHQG